MQQNVIRTISPRNGETVFERELLSQSEITGIISLARAAQREWSGFALEQRIDICRKALDFFREHQVDIGREITVQMGRPVAFSAGEVNGLLERAEHMLAIAEQSLSDMPLNDKPGYLRKISREPVGLVFIIAPWNYPLLTTVNSLFPALLAGNAVLLKASAQTPLSGLRFIDAFRQAGLPDGLLTPVWTDHESTQKILSSGVIDACCFTGSVAAGEKIESALAGQFANLTLELGGKDAAYVRADANLNLAVESLVDGAFFNSGQSCCGIERIYVDKGIYQQFVEHYIALVEQYILGDPMDSSTTLGPVVNARAAEWVREQTKAAVNQGAATCIDTDKFSANRPGSPYLAPQVLTNVDHNMSIMRDESFGPVVGIMPVADDEAAISLINDSEFGLTASLWSNDTDACLQLGQQISAGTVFMNRCDYLDPALAWTGVKKTGKGVSLSQLGFQTFLRYKSYNFNLS